MLYSLVFLRCIEYYRGILFLTTNRVGHFDDAFISRIHVIIRYENLKEDDRKKIWEQFFDKLTDERDDFTVTRRAKSYVLEDEIISKMEWNGREIRNGNTPYASFHHHVPDLQLLSLFNSFPNCSFPR